MKSFAKPNETRSFKGHGHMEALQFDDRCTIGKGVFEPGWKWSHDVKPIAGTASCQSVHTGYCISGRMTVRMDNGDEFTGGPLATYSECRPGTTPGPSAKTLAC